MGNLFYKTNVLDDAGNHGFTDPAEGQADDGDAELNAVDDLVEVAVQLLDNAGTDAAGFDELLDAGLANADQGEFGGGEERIGCDQQQDKKHLQQHVGKHRLGNSNIPKEVMHFYGKRLAVEWRYAMGSGSSLNLSYLRPGVEVRISASISSIERSNGVSRLPDTGTVSSNNLSG